MRIGNSDFDVKNEVVVMGILNVTPDSFSDGGKFTSIRTAVTRALSMEEEGAGIIDVGGESTRPGHTEVSEEEELARVIPVIRELKKVLKIPVSIDTSKAAVAREALKAGASFINDVWGFRRDRHMAEVAADFGVPCCLMHNRERAVYENLFDEIKKDLSESVAIALSVGVKEDRIILDPGIGFGKTVEHNLAVLRNLSVMKELGFPWLLGASRKSVIGKTLNVPVDERLEGTLVTTVYGVQNGASFIRVHDVKENLKAVKMVQAIEKGNA